MEDLFDFDAEVTPVLDVLVGRTIWLAKIELKDELELFDLNKKTREFEVLYKRKSIDKFYNNNNFIIIIVIIIIIIFNKLSIAMLYIIYISML